MSPLNKTSQKVNLAYGRKPGAARPRTPASTTAPESTRLELREQCRASLYLLCKGVLGFRDFHPILHRRMCDGAQRTAPSRRVELWPRDHYKTSVFSIGLPLWFYIRDPNITILLAGSTATNASRRLRRIQGVFERNATFRWLFPELIPADFSKRWNEQEAICPRTEDRLEPTFDTIGVGGRVTGRHYHVKITDDMIDETSLDSEGMPSQVVMDAAKQWFDYSEYLFESEHDAIDIVVGTRWSREDPYAHIIQDQRYLVERHAADGGCCPDHPAGDPIFPVGCNRCPDTTHSDKAHKLVGFSMDYLATLQKKDPYKYALQMRNDPVDSSITEFKPSQIKHFTWEREGSRINCGGRKIDLAGCNTYLIVDPAFTKKRKNDPTGFLVGAVPPQGGYLILDAHECRLDPLSLISAIYDRWKRWRPYEVLVEAVAGQKFIRPFLQEKARDEGVYIRCRDVLPGGNAPKLARIRGLIGPFHRGEVWIAPGLLEYVSQVTSFPSSRDHLLDCTAYLHLESRRPRGEDDEEDAEEEDQRVLNAMSRTTGY